MKNTKSLVLIILSTILLFACKDFWHPEGPTPLAQILLPPTNLTASPASTTSISLSWTPVSGARRYQVFRCLTVDGAYLPVATSSNPYYTDTGLSANTTYYYKVASINSDGKEGDRTNYATTKTLEITNAPILPPPSIFSLGDVTSKSLAFSWVAVPNAISYRIYRTIGDDDNYSLMQVVDVPNYYSATGLTPETLYYFKVSSINSDGAEGEKSNAYPVQTDEADEDEDETGNSGEEPDTGGGNSGFTFSGDIWTQQDNGSYKSKTITHNETTITRASFTTSSPNQKLLIYIEASSEYSDYAFVGNLDQFASKTSYIANSKTYGTNSKSITVEIPVAGSHYIELGYCKDVSISLYLDCAWFKLEFGN